MRTFADLLIDLGLILLSAVLAVVIYAGLEAVLPGPTNTTHECPMEGTR